MTIARFLFDNPENVVGWVASGAGDPEEKFRIIRDGRLDTRSGSVFSVIGSPPIPPYAHEFNSIGLFNNSFVAQSFVVNPVLADGSFIPWSVSTPNAMRKFYEDDVIPALDNTIYGINFLLDPDDRTAGLIVGNMIEVEVFYPTGWSPQFWRGGEDEVQLSNAGYVINRIRRPAPVEFDIPLRYLPEMDVKGDIKDLIYKLQERPCMFEAGLGHPPVYCWMVGKTPSPRYIAPGLLETTLKMRGYTEYV